MAGVVAKELGANFHITAGPAIERGGDLASLLTKLQPGDILFIDEIHRLSSAIAEVLYSAMEDFGLDIILGKGPERKVIKDWPPKIYTYWGNHQNWVSCRTTER